MARNRTMFKLTKALIRSLKGRGRYQERCSWCGKSFKPGDIVLSKASRSGGSGGSCRRWYCLNCARKLNIWVNR